MKSKECSLIQELLPLYSENLVNQETAKYIEEHLAGCTGCNQEWESFSKALPDPLSLKKGSVKKDAESRLFIRLKTTVIAAVLIVVTSGAGLAYASYTAGKHVGLDDPSYRFAQELGLFTDVNQSGTIGETLVSIEKGLFDSTRSVLFLSFSSPVTEVPQLVLADSGGRQYETRSCKGWQNKYFMFEFEPLDLDAQTVNVSLGLGDKVKDTAEFAIPVDVTKTAQHTTIIYPNQEKELSNLRITLDKAVLGVSETEFKVYFDWPVDGSMAGIGLGRGMVYFPTSVREAPDTPPPPGMGAPPPGGLMPGYAASYVVNYRTQDPPENRPALYDLAVRQEISAAKGEYRTTQFPCQVLAILNFAPVKQESKQLELLLPPVYLYQEIKDSPKLHLDFADKNELKPQIAVPFADGKITIEKAWLEKKGVYLQYRLESSAKPETVLPHFELSDTQEVKQGQMRFEPENTRTITFTLYNEEAEEFYLKLDSIGQLLPREKFTLDFQESEL